MNENNNDDSDLVSMFIGTPGNTTQLTEQETKIFVRFMRAKILYEARQLDYSDLRDMWIDGCDRAAGESTIEGYERACRENDQLWQMRIDAKKAAKDDDSDEYAQAYHNAKNALLEAIAARRQGALYTKKP